MLRRIGSLSWEAVVTLMGGYLKQIKLHRSGLANSLKLRNAHTTVLIISLAAPIGFPCHTSSQPYFIATSALALPTYDEPTLHDWCTFSSKTSWW